MLEIIAIIILSRKNGELAARKGLKSGLWIFYSVLAWIGFEIVGVIVGILAFGQDNFISIYILAIVAATSSYFFIRTILNKKPDIMDEDINKIGVNDLYP